MKEIVDVIEGQRFSRSEEVGCYICGKTRESRKIRVRFGMYAMVAECPDCGLAFQTPRPSPEASLAYMNWRWRSSDNYVGNPVSQMRRALQQVAYVRQCVQKPTRLLDFGAGAGAFVRAAIDNGWEATGVEQSDAARARAKEFYGVALMPELGEERYDVVTMWDVIEHLRDPGGILRAIGEHLTEGGLVFIETGNWQNWQRIAEKDNWGLYLFDHQFYFTPSSLRRVLTISGYNDFSLLNFNRVHPFHLKRIIRHPFHMIASWREWRKAKTKWPAHGDINVMVVVGRKMA